MSAERVLLSFPEGNRRFNFRVAGAAIREGHALVCREDEDDYCMLPGGRVEMGEPSEVALAREIEEEMALPVTIGPLLFTSESFYFREGQHFHEIGFIYALKLPDDLRPTGPQPFLTREDEGHLPHFSWVPLDDEALHDRRLLPAWLPERLRNLPDHPEHVVFVDQTA